MFRRWGTQIGLAAAFFAAVAAAQSGTAFSYQGRLEDTGGPVSGLYDFEFRLFDAALGGAQVGSVQCVDDHDVLEGLFTVVLDFGTAFSDSIRYVEIRVRPNTGLGCSEPEEFVVLSPRQRVTAAPVASHTRGIHVDSANNVGLGTMTPAARLHVAGGEGYFADAVNVGLFDDNPYKISAFSTSETAIFGKVQASSGAFGYGVYGQSDSNTGGGGVYGIAKVYGVRGHTYAPAGTSFGGYFEGRGYFSENVGIGTTTPFFRLQVDGGTDSSPGGGGYVVLGMSGGTNLALDNNEIMACSGGIASDLFLNHNGGDVIINGAGTGNVGIGTSSPTLARTQISTGNQRCIYAENSGAGVATGYFKNSGLGPAGVFEGAVNVIGSLSKSSGSFRIDHPLDPANKYLYHSFVESPDMMNVYNGNVVTDERGYATIEMPAWFEALNRDFRYQLTVLDDGDGDAFVQAKVVGKLKDNRFAIRSSAARVEVSWQITGIRRDPWAEAHRIAVEQEKPEHERGKYQHPELYGQPAESGIHFEAARGDGQAHGDGAD